MKNVIQDYEKVQKFLKRADELIIQQIHKVRIRKSYIAHLRNYRKSIEEYPLAVQYLDEITEFAEVLNAEGIEVAQPYANKAMATLDEIAKMVERHGRVWPRSPFKVKWRFFG